MSLITRDRSYYRMAVRLIFPIAFQNALFLMVNLLDTLMLGRLGEASEAAISAAGLASQPFFVFSLFIFGSVSGSSVLVAQYWGKGDTDSINSVAGITVGFASAVGILTSVLMFCFPVEVLRIFSKDERVIALGAEYLRIIVISYIPTALSGVLSGIMRSVERVKCALFSNIISLFVNIFLNYCFIFGHFGFPRLEVKGAAIATVIARFFELAFVIWYVFFHEKEVCIRPSRMIKIPKALALDFVRVSLPVVINETTWSLGTAMYSVIIGNLGTQQYSAYSVAGIIERLALVFSNGFANAGAVIIGKTVGAGEPEKAYEYSKTTLFLSACSSVLLGALIFSVRHFVVGFFDITTEAKGYAVSIITVMSILIIFKGYNLASIVGVLRGGGDTKFVLALDVIPLWTVALPIGYLFAYVFKFPVYIVYGAFYTDEMVKMVIGIMRFKSKKWIKNVTRKLEE